jgi:hypothetical protein
MPILNLTCSINIACVRGDIFMDSLSPRDRREASADTDRNFDFTTICNDYTPEARQIKGKTLKLRAFILSFSVANPYEAKSMYLSLRSGYPTNDTKGNQDCPAAVDSD